MNLTALIVAVVAIVVLMVVAYLVKNWQRKPSPEIKPTDSRIPEPKYSKSDPTIPRPEYLKRTKQGLVWTLFLKITRVFPNGSLEVEDENGKRIRKSIKNIRNDRLAELSDSVRVDAFNRALNRAEADLGW